MAKTEIKAVSIFDGDGRKKVEPVNAPAGTRPLAVTKAQGRMLAERFAERGESFHSGEGGTAWVSATACEERGEDYGVEGRPGLGFRVFRIERPEG